MRRQIFIAFALCAASACGGGDDAVEPEELGTLSIGGKADDPVTSFEFGVGAESTNTYRFDATGDLEISAEFTREEVRGRLTLVDRSESGAGQVTFFDGLGLETEESVGSSAPSLEVTGAEGKREYELTVHNADEYNARGTFFFSKPVERECIAYERPDHWFEPIARCTMIIDPKLEEESKKVVESVDLCVGTGKKQSWRDENDWYDTLQVIGEYTYMDPDRSRRSFTPKFKEPHGLGGDEDVLRAVWGRLVEAKKDKSTLFGPKEEREWRHFEYKFEYTVATQTLEYRVKSRPTWIPNWYWEVAMTIGCEPVTPLGEQ